MRATRDTSIYTYFHGENIVMNFQAPAGQWQNNGIPAMQSNNTIRPAMQPYGKVISECIMQRLHSTSNVPLRYMLYQLCSQSQFSNNLFFEIVSFAAQLAEYMMACNRGTIDQVILDASEMTIRFYSSQLILSPNMQGQVDAASYQQANQALQEFNQVKMAVQTYIANNPVVPMNQMMGGMPMGMGNGARVDPRFGGGVMPGMMPMNNGFPQPMSNMTVNMNGMNMGMGNGNFQMPMGGQTPTMNPMQAATQTTVKVTEGKLQKQAQAAQQSAVVTAPVTPSVSVSSIKPSYVINEIGGNKPNPLADLVAPPAIAAGKSVVIGTVESTPPETSGTGNILLYSDPSFDPDICYLDGNNRGIIYFYETSMGFVDFINKSHGVYNIEGVDVDYIKHRNYHLLKSTTQHGDEAADSAKFLQTLANAAMVSDVQTVLDNLAVERNEVKIDESNMLDFDIVANVNLGPVELIGGDYHSTAVISAASAGLNIDIDSSVVRMATHTSSDWNIDRKTCRAFYNILRTATRWTDISNEMIALRKIVPLYVWHGIDQYMLSVFNEINMIELDSGVYIDDSFTASLVECGKIINTNLGKDITAYLNDGLQLFKERICFEPLSTDDNAAADEDTLYLVTSEDITLLPILSKDIKLACPTEVGTVDKVATPELWGLIDLTYKSAGKNTRWIKFITSDLAVLYVYRSIISKEYLIATQVNFE